MKKNNQLIPINQYGLNNTKHVELDQIINLINNNCYFQSSYLDIENLFFQSSQSIQENLLFTKKVLEILEKNSEQCINEEFSFFPKELSFLDLLNKIAKGQTLEINEINYFLLSFEIYLKNKTLFVNTESLIKEIEPNDMTYQLKLFVSKLRMFIFKNGEYNFENHPELKDLFSKERKISKNIKLNLTKFIKNNLENGILREKQIDIYNDYYVVSIKSDHYQRSFGKIIAHSSSGNTLYVSPDLNIELSNQRIEILSLIKRKLINLCSDYTNTFSNYYQYYSKIYQDIVQLDQVNSKCKIISKFKLSEPELIHDENFNIILNNFYHPLIENCKKNNIQLKKNSSGLLISGPNTGGKTVTLKSISICHFLVHLGMFIPADNSSVYPFDNIFVWIQDGQNINEGLSSFSAEVRFLLNVLEYIKKYDHLKEKKFLLIIDEVFNSTSSEEASALAYSLFQELIKYNCIILCSTHHKKLKQYLHKNESFESSHMGFSLKDQKPTYEFKQGIPGNSMTLEVFDIISKDIDENLNQIILKRAHSYLEKNIINYEETLKELNEKQNNLDRLIRENKILNIKLIDEEKKQKGVLFLKQKTLVENFEKKINKSLDKSQSLFENLSKTQYSKKQFFKESDQIKSEFNSIKSNFIVDQDSTNKLQKSNLTFEEIKIGESYLHLLSNKKVKIVDKYEKNKTLKVAKGILKFTVKSTELTTLNKSQQKEEMHFKITKTSEIDSLTFDARGLRLEDFQSEIFAKLDFLYLDKIPYLEVIHGIGSGALKNWLHFYISKNSQIRIDEQKERNFGITIIKKV